MGDVDVAARVRRVFGLILLAAAAVILVLYLICVRFLPDLVVVDVYGPTPVVALCVAFVAGSLPLLIPQREPPADPRYNRWYIAFGLWTTMVQLVCMLGGYGRAEHETLAESIDGRRSVVVYDPDSPYACLWVWSGKGAMARTVGAIGDPGLYSSAHFADRDTVVLTSEFRGGYGLSRPSTRIRLDHRTGRPLDHTRPCTTDPRSR